MNWIMKMVGLKTLMQFAIDAIANTVKNPNSTKALELVAVVRGLRDACDEFLNKVGNRPA